MGVGFNDVTCEAQETDRWLPLFLFPASLSSSYLLPYLSWLTLPLLSPLHFSCSFVVCKPSGLTHENHLHGDAGPWRASLVTCIIRCPDYPFCALKWVSEESAMQGWSRNLVKQVSKNPGVMEPGIVVYTCNPIPERTELEALRFKDSLSYKARACIRTSNSNKIEKSFIHKHLIYDGAKNNSLNFWSY